MSRLRSAGGSSVSYHKHRNLSASDNFSFDADVLLEEKSDGEVLKEDGYVTECVRRLPKKYRGIIHLYYYEGYRQKEISELLGIKENTVASRLARGREKLKKILESDEVKNYEY